MTLVVIIILPSRHSEFIVIPKPKRYAANFSKFPIFCVFQPKNIFWEVALLPSSTYYLFQDKPYNLQHIILSINTHSLVRCFHSLSHPIPPSQSPRKRRPGSIWRGAKNPSGEILAKHMPGSSKCKKTCAFSPEKNLAKGRNFTYTVYIYIYMEDPGIYKIINSSMKFPYPPRLPKMAMMDT